MTRIRDFRQKLTRDNEHLNKEETAANDARTLVEELVEGEVVLAHEVVADGPKRAAMVATGREIGFRNGQDEWIRVVDVTRGSILMLTPELTSAR